MHLLLSARVNQDLRAATVGAWKGLGGTEQTTNQRPLVVDGAAVGPQVYAVQLVERRFLLGRRLARQTRHFFGRRSHRPTAIVATRHAFERRNLPPQIADCLAVAAHSGSFPC